MVSLYFYIFICVVYLSFHFIDKCCRIIHCILPLFAIAVLQQLSVCLFINRKVYPVITFHTSALSFDKVIYESRKTQFMCEKQTFIQKNIFKLCLFFVFKF